MTKNNKLSNAQSLKFDEFYTRYETIDKEIKHYYEYDKNVFRDKVILCPCDDPESSEFVNYFRDNFDTFGIKKLIFTSYTSPLNNKNIKNDVISLLSNISSSDNKQDTRGKLLILDRNNINTNVNFSYLKGNGDFRSEEVKNYLYEADMVVTNPPFSLFREFIKWIMDAKKEFIILGNLNALKYRDIFPYILDNKVWIGAGDFNSNTYFRVPNDFEYNKNYAHKTELNGEKVCSVSSITWFTNIKHEKRYKDIKYLSMEEISNITGDNYKFKDNLFKKYDNFDAIEIPECRYIPNDYYGMMGVPITFLDKYNPNEFELLGLDRYIKGNKTPNKCFYINGKEMYSRLVIRRKKI